MDEMFELLTLAQTEKLAKRICVVIYGRDYWDKVINFQALVDAGTISPKDLNLFHWSPATPEEAFECDLTTLCNQTPSKHCSATVPDVYNNHRPRRPLHCL